MTKKIELPTSAPRRGKGRFPARLVGPNQVQGEACSDAPRYPYMVVADPVQIVSAKLLHVIWHKVPLPDSTHPMPGAIDRVLIDDEGDFASGKTPHYASIVRGGFPLNLSAPDFCFGTCFMSFCSKGRYYLVVQVIWLDESAGPGGVPVNERNKDFLTLDITVK